MVTTDGFLLGGRVRYRQPAIGFRSGIEPVLLAASIPARDGEHVLEAGTGAGAGLLCLRHRVPGVLGTGIEIDEPTARLAEHNIQSNAFDGLEIVTASIETADPRRVYDHAMANPPYHAGDDPGSPLAARDLAKRAPDNRVDTWIQHLSQHLRHRGSLTLIVPAWRLPDCLAAMEAHGCGCTTIFPLWPKQGRAAKLILLRGIRNSRSPLRLASGLVLHQPDGAYTQETQAILGGGAALPL